uniref:Cytochrome c oxidase subunit 2 n=1 Tax=Mastigoproctus giganteus TaxID=58767 RepID=Q535F1_MASGI|nr:cytochrome c oxidase subunit II [Mastigoproctus giganteus]
MPTWNMLSFQNANSPIMEHMIFFHDHTMIILILITILVAYTMLSMFINNFINIYLLESQEIEVIWTIIPAFLLIFIALPSLRLLYIMDEMSTPDMTLKCLGHQWYWSYEYADFNNSEIESFMIPQEDSSINHFRLLDVDNHTILPNLSKIRLLISSTDVIHSWTIPSLGVKMDAIPGRLNQSSFFINRPSLLFGQCSEICGANHSFMPISIEAIPLNKFLLWMNKL